MYAGAGRQALAAHDVVLLKDFNILLLRHVQVAVRIRPISRQEVESGHNYAWNIQGNSLVPTEGRDSTPYSLDHVFGPEWTTQQIYDATTHSLLHKVVSGFNSTVFAYGARRTAMS